MDNLPNQPHAVNSAAASGAVNNDQSAVAQQISNGQLLSQGVVQQNQMQPAPPQLEAQRRAHQIAQQQMQFLMQAAQHQHQQSNANAGSSATHLNLPSHDAQQMNILLQNQQLLQQYAASNNMGGMSQAFLGQMAAGQPVQSNAAVGGSANNQQQQQQLMMAAQLNNAHLQNHQSMPPQVQHAVQQSSSAAGAGAVAGGGALANQQVQQLQAQQQPQQNQGNAQQIAEQQVQQPNQPDGADDGGSNGGGDQPLSAEAKRIDAYVKEKSAQLHHKMSNIKVEVNNQVVQHQIEIRNFVMGINVHNAPAYAGHQLHGVNGANVVNFQIPQGQGINPPNNNVMGGVVNGSNQISSNQS